MYDLAFCGDCGSERQTKFCVECGSPSPAEQSIKGSAIPSLGVSDPEGVDDSKHSRSRIYAFSLLAFLGLAAAFLMGSSMNFNSPPEDARDQPALVAETTSTPPAPNTAEAARTCRAFEEVFWQIYETNTSQKVELNGMIIYENLSRIARNYNTEEIPVEDVREAWLESLDSDSAATTARIWNALIAISAACKPHGVDLGLQ